MEETTLKRSFMFILFDMSVIKGRNPAERANVSVRMNEWMIEWMIEWIILNEPQLQRRAARWHPCAVFFFWEIASRQRSAFTASYVKGGGGDKTNKTRVCFPCGCGSQTKVSFVWRWVRFSTQRRFRLISLITTSRSINASGAAWS